MAGMRVSISNVESEVAKAAIRARVIHRFGISSILLKALWNSK
jgi:hypothetical protein